MNTKIFDFMIFFHIHKIFVFMWTTVVNRHENHKDFGFSYFFHLRKCVCVYWFYTQFTHFSHFFHKNECEFAHPKKRRKMDTLCNLRKKLHFLFFFCSTFFIFFSDKFTKTWVYLGWTGTFCANKKCK